MSVRRQCELLGLNRSSLYYQPAAETAANLDLMRRIDEEYTAKIKASLSDPRISTELVDHLPASATVPTPLKFLGHIVGA